MPLDYRRPGGDTLDLALLRVPARDPDRRIGSLVVNPGGPGVPGTSCVAAADQAFRAPLRDRFDIVGPGPRGTGASDPVDCLSDTELDDYVGDDPDPDTAAEKRQYRHWLAAFGRGQLATLDERISRRREIRAACGDLLAEVPETADWLAGLDGRLVVGNYLYADGGTHVRVSVAADVLASRVTAARPDTAVAFLATPTDVFAIAPDDLVRVTNGRVVRLSSG